MRSGGPSGFRRRAGRSRASRWRPATRCGSVRRGCIRSWEGSPDWKQGGNWRPGGVHAQGRWNERGGGTGLGVGNVRAVSDQPRSATLAIDSVATAAGSARRTAWCRDSRRQSAAPILAWTEDTEVLVVLFDVLDAALANRHWGFCRCGASGAGRAGQDSVRVDVTADDGEGERGELEVVVAGVLTQRREGRVHADAIALAEHALGLLDGDPAVERGLQLLGQHRAAVRGALLQDADGGHIRQRLRQVLIGRGHRPGPVVEQVERADRLRPQPHWDRGDGAETGGAGRRDEQRPAGLVAREVAAGDGRAGPDAVQAGPLVVLQLEDPQQPALLAGGGHDRQVALLVIEQQASGGHPE